MFPANTISVCLRLLSSISNNVTIPGGIATRDSFFGKVNCVAYVGKEKCCHPERAWCSAQRIRISMIAGGNHTIMYGESKDLGTDLTANVDEMRRFLDSAVLRSE